MKTRRSWRRNGSRTLPAHGDAVVRLSLPAESCGKRRLVAVAGPGLPIADERESMPVMIECGGGRAAR